MTTEEVELAEKYTPEQFVKEHIPEYPDFLPWEKLPHESPKAFRAFEVYRDAGPKRSHRTAYADNGYGIDAIGAHVHGLC